MLKLSHTEQNLRSIYTRERLQGEKSLWQHTAINLRMWLPLLFGGNIRLRL